ncbi:MAG: glycosyltransferase, partial [Actinobacteria bacterium]|nr:glycosyltransferase [Actinomycetota bacterium]
MKGSLLARRAAVLGGLVAVTRLPGLLAARTFNTDEATLAVGGRALRGGGSLYVDVIDRKPPLPFAAYALAG